MLTYTKIFIKQVTKLRVQYKLDGRQKQELINEGC